MTRQINSELRAALLQLVQLCSDLTVRAPDTVHRSADPGPRADALWERVQALYQEWRGGDTSAVAAAPAPAADAGA